MSTDRGMKKFAPFSSLIEQNDYLDKMKYEKRKVDKPLIANERAEKINNILTNYNGELLEIDYYYDGYIYRMVKEIKRVDVINKRLIFEEGNLPFKAIVDINYK